MPSIRIVFAGVIAAVAVVAALDGASAQTATGDHVGQPLALLAGLRPPHEPKSIIHAKTARRTGKHLVNHLAANKSATRKSTKLAKRTHHERALAQSEMPKAAASAIPASSTPANTIPANTIPAKAIPASAIPASAILAHDWPPADAAAPAVAAAAGSPETAPADGVPGTVSVGGETVQVASQDQVNEIDLAADDAGKAPSERAATAPVPQAVFAAPTAKPASPVGSVSWIAQVLAALGGAVAAGTLAWFLIGGGPQRMYG